MGFVVTNRLVISLLILIIVTSRLVYAAEWHKVNGAYAISSKNMVSLIEDSHLKIQLKGDSARDLYMAMKTIEKPDECADGMSKTAGEMQCIFYPAKKKYQCYFSIDIMQQKIEFGIPC